jgi:hypothetical protein
MGITQTWEPSKMSNQLQIIDVESKVVSGVSSEAKAFAAEQLGPMPGQWNGYEHLDESTSQELYGKVGYIHGLSAEAGRQIITIGQTLLEIKELVPHGQFMDCVKAEFEWNRTWVNQLMQVAERFSNYHPSGNLPSSAKVLALLAASDADDDTVQQAADERWTVKQTRQRLGNERQRERSIVQEAISVLKLSEEARHLAAKAEHISTRQLMDELDTEELPKGREHITTAFTFCKNGAGWWKLPIQQPVAVAADPEPIGSGTVEILPMATAAQLLGKKSNTFRTRMSPGSIAKHGFPTGLGWQAEPHPARGMCIVRRIG